MFRPSILRSAVTVAARLGAARTVSGANTISRSQQFVASFAKNTAAIVAPRVATLQAVRFYAGGGGLNKEEVEGRIISLLSGFDKVNDANNIKPTSHFANDLGLDSLDTVEVVMAIEDEFSIEIPDKDADKIHSVEDAVRYILSQPEAL